MHEYKVKTKNQARELKCNKAYDEALFALGDEFHGCGRGREGRDRSFLGRADRAARVREFQRLLQFLFVLYTNTSLITH